MTRKLCSLCEARLISNSHESIAASCVLYERKHAPLPHASAYCDEHMELLQHAEKIMKRRAATKRAREARSKKP